MSVRLSVLFPHPVCLICLSVYLYVRLPHLVCLISLSVYLYVRQPHLVCQSVYPSVHLRHPICLIHFSGYLSVCHTPFVLFVRSFVNMFVLQALCLSIYLPDSPLVLFICTSLKLYISVHLLTSPILQWSYPPCVSLSVCLTDHSFVCSFVRLIFYLRGSSCNLCGQLIY